ncbi:MAG: hypothetical protein ACD_75C01955G0003 [uncultured bacterium]|nr:MAG: hypothetical protein ACD_75C01955G0003 [uncultured bacterium]
MIRNSKTLIVIPAYNNGLTLPAVAKAALATGYDLLVIDDGSDDDCLASLAGLPGRTLRTLRFAEHHGKGAALLHGAGQAAQLGYDLMVTMDGDGRCDPADIHLLAAEAENCTTPCLIVGERQMVRGTAAKKSLPHFLVRLECGIELPDTESSFRLYPLKELLAVNPTEKHGGFAIETLVKLAWSGVRIRSVPVTCRPSTDERIGLFRAMGERFDSAWLHCRLVTRRLLPWPHKKLSPREPFRQQVSETISQNPVKVLGKICREHSSPLWLAMAVWLGIFMGALPLLAVHTIAIIYVAHRLHINKVAAVAASQFCMPPVVPVLCIQMGYYLRNGELLFDFTWQRWLLEIHERCWEWLIGSLLIGPLLGLIGAGVMYWMAARLQNRRDIKPSIGA